MVAVNSPALSKTQAYPGTDKLTALNLVTSVKKIIKFGPEFDANS